MLSSATQNHSGQYLELATVIVVGSRLGRKKEGKENIEGMSRCIRENVREYRGGFEEQKGKRGGVLVLLTRYSKVGKQ